MQWIRVLSIAIVQGITECLPVSSSGHLVLIERLIDIRSSGVALELLLHLGTLAAAVVFYRGTWRRLLTRLDRPGNRRYLGLLVAASIPVGAVGFAFHDAIAAAFHNTRLVAVDLVAGGAFIVFAGRRRGEGAGEVGVLQAIAIGCAQAIAILPGISRSGMTVATGLVTGLKRERAVEFSFLMSVPAVLGATAGQIGEIGKAASEWGAGMMLAAAAAAFVSGYIAIGILLRFVVKGRFSYFGYYCIFVGAAGLLWG